MSVYWILKRYSPPLTEAQIMEMATEIDCEIVDPLKAEIEALKAARATPEPKPKRKS